MEMETGVCVRTCVRAHPCMCSVIVILFTQVAELHSKQKQRRRHRNKPGVGLISHRPCGTARASSPEELWVLCKSCSQAQKCCLFLCIYAVRWLFFLVDLPVTPKFGSVLCLSLPASAPCSQPSGDISPSTACAI